MSKELFFYCGRCGHSREALIRTSGLYKARSRPGVSDMLVLNSHTVYADTVTEAECPLCHGVVELQQLDYNCEHEWRLLGPMLRCCKLCGKEETAKIVFDE